MTQPTYAPELEILGAAVGGTSFVNIFNSKILYINKGPIAGFIPTILTGLGAQHPQVHQVVQKQLKPEQRELFKKVLDQCVEANKATFAGLDIVGMFYDFDPVKKALERAAWAERFETSTPPKTPILWLESEEDQIFPVRNAEKEVDRYCRRGARIHFLRDTGKGFNHATYGTLVLGGFTSFNWLEGLVAGKELEQECFKGNANTIPLDPAEFKLFSPQALETIRQFIELKPS